MSMFSRFLLIGFLGFSTLLATAGTARPTNPTRRNASIDFATLPGLENKTDYSLHLKLVVQGGNYLEQKYNIGAGSHPETVRDLVFASLRGGKWKIKTVDKTVMEIEAYLERPIEKVEAECPGLPKKNQPVVKQRSR